MLRDPINVRCSIFNDIIPIRDLYFHLNNSHWLIRTHAWAVSAKDWEVAFFQWIIAWCVREKIGVVGKCWVSLHSRNAPFNGGGTMWGRNRISLDTTKGWFLWIDRYFRWYFIIVCIEQIVYFKFPNSRDVIKRRVWKCWMDVQYWIVAVGSAATPFLLDSKALRSESDIFATRARGSCGVDPGRPVPLRIVIISASSIGVWLYGVRKRVVLSRSLMFSTFAILHFKTLIVWGADTDFVLIRATKGLPGATGFFEGRAPSSA